MSQRPIIVHSQTFFRTIRSFMRTLGFFKISQEMDDATKSGGRNYKT